MKLNLSKKDRINVSDNFLNLKIPEFAQEYPQLTGSLVEQYVYVNSKVREAIRLIFMPVPCPVAYISLDYKAILVCLPAKCYL